ncbi:MAG: hypothetical protein Q8J89_11730 [Caulobacter sp.]|nr:hypothetical protein [Caulobacter sp.]
MRFSTAVIAVAILTMASQASAEGPPADAAVSTAPAEGAGAPLSTRQQIDQYLASSPAATPAPDLYRQGDAAREAEGKRRIRGEVSLGVGTGGYRNGSVSAVIPLGETGALALGYSRTENGYGFIDHGQRGYVYDDDFDSLSAPLSLETGCDASLRGRGWYNDVQPELTGRIRTAAERCATR